MTRRALTLLAVVLILAPAGGAAADPPLATTFLTYSGTFDVVYATSTSTDHPRGIPGDVAHADLTWTARAAISSQDFYNGTHKHWRFSTLQGRFKYDLLPATPGGRQQHCDQALREKTGYEASAPSIANVYYDQSRDEYTVTVSVPFDALAVTTGLPQLDPCAAFAYYPHPDASDKSGARVNEALGFTVTVKAGGPYVIEHAGTWQAPAPAPEATLKVDSKLQISAGVKGASPPPENPLPPADESAKVKAAAREDLPTAFTNAKTFCVPYAAGLGTFGAGVLVVGLGPIAGGALAAAGATLATVAQPFCRATLTRLRTDLLRVYDPPDLRIHTLAQPAAVPEARLAACTQYPAAGAALCGRLRPEVGKLLAAAGEAASVSVALTTTLNRLVAAEKSHDTKALAAQSEHAAQLLRELQQAERAQTSAGAAVAATLRSAHLAMRLTVAQSAQAVSAVLGYLARNGLPKERVTGAVAAKELAPAPADVLAILGG